MKRATRVPASSVLRMNSASNMIAKWYHSAITASPPSELRENMRHPDRQRGRAAGARIQRRLADAAASSLHLLRR